MIPTPEQEAIILAAANRRESLMINAYAGCGKTTTLALLANALPRDTPGLALAFNVKIKKELEKIFPVNFQVLTLNGLGHRAFGSMLGKRLEVVDKKLGTIVSRVLKANGFQAGSHEWGIVRELVSEAMQVGIVPKPFPQPGFLEDTPENWQSLLDPGVTPEDALIHFAREALVESITESFAGRISYDDQIYMSVLFGGRFPRYSKIVLDEAQDLSIFNHKQVAKSLLPDARLFACGDNKQAIYAFRGADSSSMEKIRALRSEWLDLPLATTFRCPKVVVERQQVHAPGFRAADTNLPGKYIRWPLKEPTWDDRYLQLILNQGNSLAVICRNNAPLLGLAFKLLRRGVSVHFLGRDLGKSLITLAKKLFPTLTPGPSLCAQIIRDWETTESSKAILAGDDGKAENIKDKAECLIAVLDSSDKIIDSQRLIMAVESLFSTTGGSVVLSTGHKAKGLEWDAVVHLDPWRVPAKGAAAKGGKALEQEQNLKYVIETRAKRYLIEASLDTFS